MTFLFLWKCLFFVCPDKLLAAKSIKMVGLAYFRKGVRENSPFLASRRDREDCATQILCVWTDRLLIIRVWNADLLMCMRRNISNWTTFAPFVRTVIDVLYTKDVVIEKLHVCLSYYILCQTTTCCRKGATLGPSFWPQACGRVPHYLLSCVKAKFPSEISEKTHEVPYKICRGICRGIFPRKIFRS